MKQEFLARTFGYVESGSPKMYPLIEIGPLRLSSGGLLLLLAVMVGSTLVERIARTRGGKPLAEQAGNSALPILLGAIIGARLWYGLFNWDLYGRTPSLFLALRVADLAWPGALVGGMLVGWLWGRWQRADTAALADAAALSLPLAQVIACIGLLLSGEAFGTPTSLPWGVALFGTTRHPTQIYLAIASVLSYGLINRFARHSLPAGALFAAYIALQGLTLLLVEALRADSLLLPYGIRSAQVVGLLFILAGLLWWRNCAEDPLCSTTIDPTLGIAQPGLNIDHGDSEQKGDAKRHRAPFAIN